MPNEHLKIGVLAVQGNFREHAAVLRRLGAEPVEVRKVEQLEGHPRRRVAAAQVRFGRNGGKMGYLTSGGGSASIDSISSAICFVSGRRGGRRVRRPAAGRSGLPVGVVGSGEGSRYRPTRRLGSSVAVSLRKRASNCRSEGRRVSLRVFTSVT